MPCPYFEPQRIAPKPCQAFARLPLIEEYEGICHAHEQPTDVLAAVRFRCCNHGYSRGCCERYPPTEIRSCARYNVIRRSEAALEVLCVEERDYTPVRWRSAQYSIASDTVTLDAPDVCLKAQLLAFCRSYIKRFPV